MEAFIRFLVCLYEYVVIMYAVGRCEDELVLKKSASLEYYET